MRYLPLLLISAALAILLAGPDRRGMRFALSLLAVIGGLLLLLALFAVVVKSAS